MKAATIVRRGAQFLDEHKPGWARKIKPEELDLASGHSCVLGQLYGSFSRGRNRLFVGRGPQKKAMRLGFDAARLDDYSGELVGPTYAELTKEWLVQIALRLKRRRH